MAGVTFPTSMVVVSRVGATLHPGTVGGLVCDLDGTLIDAAAELTAAYNDVFLAAGLPRREESWVKPYIGRPPADIFRANGADHGQAMTLTHRLRELLADVAGTGAVVYPDTEPLLERALDQGIPVAIATNRPGWLALRVLRRTGLAHWFARVVGTGELPPKPAPDTVLAAMATDHTAGWWMVGDTADDVIAGRAAGLRTYAVVRDDTYRASLEPAGPDIARPDLTTLASWLGCST